MRCSCQVCDTYMVHSESMELGCVCPQCGARCKMCLGTNSVVPRGSLREAAAGILASLNSTEVKPHDENDDYEKDPYRD